VGIAAARESRRAASRLSREIARDRYPARIAAVDWPVTRFDGDTVWGLVMAPPYVLANPATELKRQRGVDRLLIWLEAQPGESWQQRWQAAGAEDLGARWRSVPTGWFAERGVRSQWLASELSAGLRVLTAADVIRPSLAFLAGVPSLKADLVDELALARDPRDFARLTEYLASRPTPGKARVILSRTAVILAAKGGTISEITVGDVLELAEVETEVRKAWPYELPGFYHALRALGHFGPEAPTHWRQLRTAGQHSPAELIDRYRLACRPIRDLLVDYLCERQPSLDYTSLRDLAYYLGSRFWKDLELHHPGIDSADLPPEVAAAWRQRLAHGDGQGQGISTGARSTLATVRAFYLDLSQWALEDPSRWAHWVAPCPVPRSALENRKAKRQHKARMDARTRERLPVLPILVRTVQQRRADAAALLAAARAAAPGTAFTAADQHLIRPVPSRTARFTTKTWGLDPETGRRRDLGKEEEYAFWAWAAVEVLRLTGVRIEELLEITHHSLIQYRLPATGELIPLLQIAPSKTDAERLLVVSPELAEVLSTIIQRIRQADGTVPLVPAYDWHECVWRPPTPLLFQRVIGGEYRAISHGTVRTMLQAALAHTGLTDPADGKPLNYTPHDFRRMFITEAIMNGLPPHIAQVIAGHRDINVTLGYKAVYPDEAIQAHLAFLARRRALRPTDEYRAPTDEEWEQFLGHFERRKVSTGVCGRALSTPCIHEHACLRCSMHWPDPAQRPRILEIRDNLEARIAEAEREGWLGEVEGLRISLAGANDKITQIDRRRTPIDLGMPAALDNA
jgi:Phage integrase family